MRSSMGAPGRRGPANIAVLGLLVLGGLLLTGCLGPDAPDPTGTAPYGHLESVVATRDGFRAVGWVADPDTTAPIAVTVMSEQRKVVATASLARPDVAAVHPGAGADHGFDVPFTGLAPGPHQVCVWADNVGAGSDARALGCTTVVVPTSDPIGNVEEAVVSADHRVRVSGWALDPETADPIAVGLLVDGSPVVTSSAASVPRPDVAAAFGLGASHGFSLDVPATTGTHQFCVIAANVGFGSPAWLGCRTVTVPVSPPDTRPQGSVTDVVPVLPDGVRITGSVTDPDTAGAVQVRITVDGGVPRTVSTAGGSFSTTFTGLSAGTHRVCAVALDVPTSLPGPSLSGDRAWPCGTVVLGDVSAGTSGAPSAPTPVGPAPGTPLALIDRDAGVSVQLRDGSVLWLFGDSSQQSPTGQLQYFVHNTAAWAASGSPAITQDAVDGAQPFPFVSPEGSTWTCPADKPTRAMWPLSAVAVPSGPLDVVTAFFGNVCLGPGPLQIESRGVAVVRWTYDPSSPPAGRPITGTVLVQQLFPADLRYGTAAVTDGTWIYGYQCTSPPDGPGIEWPTQFGPCTVGRVPVASVGTRGAWTFWNGTSWVASSSDAAPVTASVAPGVDPQLPVSSATVVRDPAHGVYVMAYSPWPGFTDRILVRVASAPQGPWSDPVEVSLPGCDDDVAGVGYYCYAGTVQPQLSTPGLLGLGYYDQLVAVGPNRGQYLTVTVPFSVLIAPG